MEKIIDRLITALDYTELSNPALEKKTGVKAESWKSVRNRKIRTNEDHMEGLKIVCPNFVYWVMTGEELPEAGQISPMTEEARVKLKRA